MPKTIPYASIDASGRLRPVDMDHAAFLAASFEEKGVQTPIVVTPRGDGFKLVEGGHRHAGMGLLGWADLKVGEHVVIKEMDDLDARLAEIDENLIRRELNPLDRALFLAERRRVYEQKHEIAGHGGDRKSSRIKDEIKSAQCGLGFAPRFSAEVAERVGLSEDTIHRALHIAKNLHSSTIAALRGTPIERNQRQLLMLCDLEQDQQISAASAIVRGEAKNVAQARVAIGLDKKVVEDEQQRVLANVLHWWSRATPRTRKLLMAELELEPRKNGGRDG